jgi:prostaglandin reductase 3
VINYTKENIGDVLQSEYPKGIDLTFETVGGDTFKTAVENVATHGRILVFGYIAGYMDKQQSFTPLPVSVVNPILLAKSASVRGFMLPNHVAQIPTHLERLFELIQAGKLKPGVDPTPFNGLEGIADAVDYMYERKNIGKLVVKLAESP